MLNDSENSVNNPPVVNEFSIVITVIKIVILAIFLVPLAKYTIISKDEYKNSSTDLVLNITNLPKNYTLQLRTNITNEKKPDVQRVIIKQPSCSRSYQLVILREICIELFEKNEFCTPEDFYDHNKHKIPRRIAKNQSNKEPKVPTIINYAVGGLLMTSLGAALIEFYKARRQPSKKSGKNPLSRKCSLADLTVMKHHRKELVRRESLLEVPEEGQKLGFRPPPLHRRCSFPVGPTLNSYGSSSDLSRHIPFIDGKPASVIDSRRQSVVMDSRRTSVDYRNVPIDGRNISISEQDSPERRHHSRLVHRH